MELTAQGKELLSANQESLNACIMLRDCFGKNYTSLIDCVEAQTRLDNQLDCTTDSDAHNAKASYGNSKCSRKHRCSSAQDFNTARKCNPAHANSKSSPSDDMDVLPVRQSDPLVLETPERPVTARHKTRKNQRPNLLDQVVELHVGQAAMTDKSVNSSQHSDSDANRQVHHKFTTGNVRKKRNAKKTSSVNLGQDKADVKTKREALLQRLLLNEVNIVYFR